MKYSYYFDRLLLWIKDPVQFYNKVKRQIYLRRLKKKDIFAYTLEMWQYEGLRAGKNCIIFPSADILSEPFLVELGDNVIITGSVKILTHDGSPMIFRKEIGEKEIYGKVKIGNNVFIGMNSVILPNVTIGNEVIIGAGSIVTRNIPGNSVVLGNPAKVITKASISKKFMLHNKNLMIRTSTIPREDTIKMLFTHFELNIDEFPYSFKHLKILRDDVPV